MIENSLTAHMWIGLEAERRGNTSRVNLKWVNGAPVTFTNLDSSLDRLVDKGGAAVGESAATGLWNLRPGSERYGQWLCCAKRERESETTKCVELRDRRIGYICERVRDGRTTPLQTTTPQPPNSCGPAFLSYRNWCYQVRARIALARRAQLRALSLLRAALGLERPERQEFAPDVRPGSQELPRLGRRADQH